MQHRKSARLILRPLTAADAEAVFAIFGDREVMRFSLHGPLVSLDECAAFIEDNAQRQASHGYSFWGVVERTGGMLVGTCGFASFGFEPGGIELAYRLRRDRWGRGYATEAARSALAHGFGPLGLRRVIAAVEPANAASLRVVEKCGFTFAEARLMAGRQARVYTLESAAFVPPAAEIVAP